MDRDLTINANVQGQDQVDKLKKNLNDLSPAMDKGAKSAKELSSETEKLSRQIDAQNEKLLKLKRQTDEQASAMEKLSKLTIKGTADTKQFYSETDRLVDSLKRKESHISTAASVGTLAAQLTPQSVLNRAFGSSLGSAVGTGASIGGSLSLFAVTAGMTAYSKWLDDQAKKQEQLVQTANQLHDSIENIVTYNFLEKITGVSASSYYNLLSDLEQKISGIGDAYHVATQEGLDFQKQLRNIGIDVNRSSDSIETLSKIQANVFNIRDPLARQRAIGTIFSNPVAANAALREPIGGIVAASQAFGGLGDSERTQKTLENVSRVGRGLHEMVAENAAFISAVKESIKSQARDLFIGAVFSQTPAGTALGAVANYLDQSRRTSQTFRDIGITPTLGTQFLQHSPLIGPFLPNLAYSEAENLGRLSGPNPISTLFGSTAGLYGGGGLNVPPVSRVGQSYQNRSLPQFLQFLPHIGPVARLANLFEEYVNPRPSFGPSLNQLGLLDITPPITQYTDPGMHMQEPQLRFGRAVTGGSPQALSPAEVYAQQTAGRLQTVGASSRAGVLQAQIATTEALIENVNQKEREYAVSLQRQTALEKRIADISQSSHILGSSVSVVGGTALRELQGLREALAKTTAETQQLGAARGLTADQRGQISALPRALGEFRQLQRYDIPFEQQFESTDLDLLRRQVSAIGSPIAQLGVQRYLINKQSEGSLSTLRAQRNTLLEKQRTSGLSPFESGQLQAINDKLKGETEFVGLQQEMLRRGSAPLFIQRQLGPSQLQTQFAAQVGQLTAAPLDRRAALEAVFGAQIAGAERQVNLLRGLPEQQEQARLGLIGLRGQRTIQGLAENRQSALELFQIENQRFQAEAAHVSRMRDLRRETGKEEEAINQHRDEALENQSRQFERQRTLVGTDQNALRNLRAQNANAIAEIELRHEEELTALRKRDEETIKQIRISEIQATAGRETERLRTLANPADALQTAKRVADVNLRSAQQAFEITHNRDALVQEQARIQEQRLGEEARERNRQDRDQQDHQENLNRIVRERRLQFLEIDNKTLNIAQKRADVETKAAVEAYEKEGLRGQLVRQLVDVQLQKQNELARQQQAYIENLKQSAGGVFDALVARGQTGVRDFFHGLLLTQARTIFQNIVGELATGPLQNLFSSALPGQVDANGQLTGFGRILRGTYGAIRPTQDRRSQGRIRASAEATANFYEAMRNSRRAAAVTELPEPPNVASGVAGELPLPLPGLAVSATPITSNTQSLQILNETDKRLIDTLNELIAALRQFGAGNSRGAFNTLDKLPSIPNAFNFLRPTNPIQSFYNIPLPNIDIPLREKVTSSLHFDGFASGGMIKGPVYANVAEREPELIVPLHSIVRGSFAGGSIVRTPQRTMLGMGYSQAVIPMSKIGPMLEGRLPSHDPLSALNFQEGGLILSPDVLATLATIPYGISPSGSSSAGSGISGLGLAGAGIKGVGAALGVRAGFLQGGLKGGLTAGAAGLGGLASILPLLGVAVPWLAPAAAGLALLTALLPNQRAERQKQLNKMIQDNIFYQPVPWQMSASTTGTYADSDRFGGIRTSNLSPYPQVQEPYYDYRHQVMVPGRVLSQYGPPVQVNVQTMDAKSFIENHAMIGDAVAHSLSLESSPSLLQNIRRYSG